ncbi:hypothetical protein EKO27_g9061 [Xylaria grammica]|uniref:Beta-glucuronidase C-terminal domain-containing protein n=1 Tax=Xylaria grammica TaxID=363999 RepID=A0A439CV82_9PEZI|nr:hypothetical protein EKO27_g9061 [Xylaria grammica]
MTLSRGLLTTAVAGLAVAQNKSTVSISVPSNISTRVLAPDVYGYSIEPVWLDSYLNTSLASTLLGNIANVVGKAAPIRVGGNTADQTYLYPSSPLPLTGTESAAIPDPLNAKSFNITPRWFDTWATYFPAGTDLIFTLNLKDNSSSWANAVAEAEAAHAGLGDSLVAFELGNEIDHFINKGWRDASWGVQTYIEQFQNLTGQITGSDWYQALAASKNSTHGETKKAPTFQAAVFADPPLVPDQQDEIDDFSIANLTAGGIASRPEDKSIISSYAVHLYPQSTCDTPRWYRLRPRDPVDGPRLPRPRILVVETRQVRLQPRLLRLVELGPAEVLWEGPRVGPFCLVGIGLGHDSRLLSALYSKAHLLGASVMVLT